MHKILVVEDDISLAAALNYSLADAGYRCRIEPNYKSAEKLLKEGDIAEEYSLLIFDVMLPDGNGYDLLKLYRSKGLETPAIFLTAVSDEDSIVKGLDIGADDYITKPFRNAELLSRVRAILRRYDNAAAVRSSSLITYRELSIDEKAARVYLSGEEITLSAGEYRLLMHFIRNQGICLTRSSILENIFDESGNFVEGSALYVYVNRLRDKIGDLKRPDPYIKTVRGIGYRMERV